MVGKRLFAVAIVLGFSTTPLVVAGDAAIESAPEESSGASGAGQPADPPALPAPPLDDHSALPFDPAEQPLDPYATPLVEDKPYWRTNVFKRAFVDQKFVVLTWWPGEVKRWTFTAPLVLGISSALASSRDEHDIDLSLERSLDARTNDKIDAIAGDFTKLGNGIPMTLVLGATYVLARHAGNTHLAATSSLSAEALLNVGIWSIVFKSVAARSRPEVDTAGSFGQYGTSENGSFPSGHAMAAFAVATVFAHQYHDHRWVPWVAYGTASLVGLSRIVVGRHFPSDVIVGGILGNSLGNMVLTRGGVEDGPLAATRFRPVYDAKRQGYGLMYSYDW